MCYTGPKCKILNCFNYAILSKFKKLLLLRNVNMFVEILDDPCPSLANVSVSYSCVFSLPDLASVCISEDSIKQLKNNMFIYAS